MALRDWFAPRREAAGFTAASTILEATDDSQRNRVRRGAAAWQNESWAGYYDIPELADALNYRANALGKIRVSPAVRVDPREDPVLLDPDGDDDLELTPVERAAMVATVERLGAGEQPIGELQRLLALNLDVAGDANLVGFTQPDNRGETWDILSVQDLVPNPNGQGWARRTLPGESTLSADPFPKDAFVARLYHRDPQFGKAAYSQMRSALGIIDELRILTDSIRAVSKSRIPAGMLVMSNKFRGGPNDPTLAGQRDEGKNDPLAQTMLEHFTTPIKSQKSASAVAPYLAFVDTTDVRQEIMLVEPQRKIDEWALKVREELRGRLAAGIMLPVDALNKSGINHWGVWNIDEDTFKYYLDPGARVMVNALTTGYYQPHLAKMGLPDPRFVLWFDPTPLVAHPNQAQDYQDGWDRIIVSDEAYRRAKGISEADAPDEEEVARRVWQDLVKHARTAPLVIPTPDEIQAQDITGDIPTQVVSPGGVPPVTAPPDTPVAPESTTKAPPVAAPPVAAAIDLPPMRSLAASGAKAGLGAQLAQIEATLRVRLAQAADDATARVLERAGMKLRNLAVRRSSLREVVHEVPLVEIAKTLGESRVASLKVTTGDLLDGAFVGLAPKWDDWVGRAQAKARAALIESGDLSDADAQELASAQERHRAEGWAVLLAGLTAYAAARVYEPNVPAPERGEWSAQTVTPSILAAALRAAGGGTAACGSSGLLSGEDVVSSLDKAGLEVLSYTWVVGDPDRPFEPHQNLDGATFETWDDPVLANDGVWPPVAFFSPNDGPEQADHEGCQCSVEMQIVPVSDAGATTEAP